MSIALLNATYQSRVLLENIDEVLDHVLSQYTETAHYQRLEVVAPPNDISPRYESYSASLSKY